MHRLKSEASANFEILITDTWDYFFFSEHLCNTSYFLRVETSGAEVSCQSSLQLDLGLLVCST